MEQVCVCVCVRARGRMYVYVFAIAFVRVPVWPNETNATKLGKKSHALGYMYGNICAFGKAAKH